MPDILIIKIKFKTINSNRHEMLDFNHLILLIHDLFLLLVSLIKYNYWCNVDNSCLIIIFFVYLLCFLIKN